MAEISSQALWLVILGTLALIILIFLIIVSVLINNRKLLHVQQEKLISIQKSEQQYADLFNNVTDLVYIHQFDGTITKINSAVKSILGYSPEEVIGRKFQEVFGIPAKEFYEYIHSLDYEGSVTGIIKLKGKSGNYYIFGYKNSVIRDGKIINSVRGIARDITESFKSEEKLRQKDALLSAMADATYTLLVEVDHKRAINKVLSILGNAVNADRVYIFENHTDLFTGELLMSQRFEWCKKGIEPQIDNPILQNLPYNHTFTKPLYEKLKKGEIFSGITRLLSGPEKEILELQNIKSILIIPIYIGKRFWGFIGFDDCTNERLWNEVEISILKATAGSVGGLVGLMELENQLTETNIFLRAILESSVTIAIITLDLDGKITYWNKGAEKVFGYKANEIYDQTITGSIISTDNFANREKFQEIIAIVLNNRDIYTAELLCYNKDKNQIWVNFTVSPLINEKDEVVGFSAIGEDITQRKITELALIQNEEMFRNVWENSADGMRLVDEDGKVKLVNRAYCELVKVPYEKLIGQPFNIAYYNLSKNDVKKFVENLNNRKFPTRESTTLTLWDGSQVAVEISNSIIELQNNKKLLLSIFHDISEQKEYERKIKQSEENYRRLAIHLQTIREEERTKISREIHDQLGQLLTALNLDFLYIKSLSPSRKKEFEERIDAISNLIDELVVTVQRISSELRPSILDDLGLIPAIEWELSQFQKRSEIKTHLTINLPDKKYDRNISTVVFRILQETLTNVLRHSLARTVTVKIENVNNQIVLTIIDDGIGIPKEKLRDPKSLGLIGMKERAYAVGGELLIDSIVGKGTTITLKVPLNGVSNDKNLTRRRSLSRS